ncbi:MAG: helicase HerA-like domain-containing protein [Thermodesulfobacteriota bacterium]
MRDEASIYIGGNGAPQSLALRLANRHGLIAGATGTGKTVSLQILAEGFSAAGVPVFMADVKGDLAGISQKGSPRPELLERAKILKMTGYAFRSYPAILWDLFGEQGHPVRATVSDMGPLLLARLLDLNEVQEGILNIIFKLADDQGLLLLDLKDLRSMVTFVAEHSRELTTRYGNVQPQSVGAIQRRLLVLEQQGAENFFGEPALELRDLMRLDSEGNGYISILAADKLMENPRLYATFMLWLLSELFEELPEIGDPEKPKLVFFFDEAHLLFDGAPKSLIEKVELVARLIRSKGVGVYFISQSPLDIPEKILGQLGNRIQHALRAFTPKDQKAVRSAAETFRQNRAFDAAEAITQLGVGEALVSTLQPKGVPGVVERILIRPPSSRMGPITPEERQDLFRRSPVRGLYEQTIDRESAYEQLRAKAEHVAQPVEKIPQSTPPERIPSQGWGLPEILTGTGKRQGVLEAMAKSVARSIGSSIGRQIARGVLGSIFKGK